MNDKKHCMKSCLLSVLGVFVFLNLYGWLVHGNLLMDDYKATASLWRTPEDMKNFCGGWLAYYALLSFVVTCWFKKTRACLACCKNGPAEAAKTCCPIKSGGLCFGMKLGLVMGMGMGCAYFYMPIPLSLGVKWFFAGLVEGLGIGAILGMLCKNAECATSCTTESK